MSNRICPKCNRSVEPSERFETAKKKKWLIEYCGKCGFNFDLVEWTQNITKEMKHVDPERKASWFKSGLFKRPDKDSK